MELILLLAITVSIIAVLTVYNFVLLVNSANKSMHSSLVVLGVLLIGYYISHFFVFTASSLADGIFYFKAIFTFVCLAAIPFNFFLKNYTGYNNKFFFRALILSFLLLAAYNMLQPFGLSYDSIESIVPQNTIWKEALVVTGKSSIGIDVAMLIVVLQVLYVIISFRHQFNYGKKNDTLFLGVLLSFIIIINIFDTYIYNLNEQFSYALLYLILSIRVSNQVLDSYRLRELLFEVQEKYRRIVDNSSFGVFQINEKGEFEFLNNSGKAILGFDKTNEAKSAHFFSFFTDQDAVTFFCGKITSKSIVENLETTIKDFKGEEKYVRIFARPEVVNGEVSVIEGIIEDFGEKKKAESLLIEARRTAEKSSRLKSEFLAMMSHEIRTPLNILIGSSEIVEEEVKELGKNDLDRFFINIRNAGQRILRTIETILLISELKTGTYEIKNRPCDLQLVLLPAVKKYSKALKDAGSVPINIHSPETPLLVTADAYSLQQVISQLLDNAVKYTPEGEVTISLRNKDANIEIEVADTGIGMTDEFLQKLFLPFSQEDQSLSRPYEGNGLGLSVVSELCKLINSEISVQSSKGKGSVFTIRLNEFRG